jgi:hypothetical protein
MKRAINAGRSNVDKWYLTVNDSIEHFVVESIHVQRARQGYVVGFNKLWI